MRSMLLAGFVALTAVAAIAPAHAQSTGGISITRGGGNVNVARGAFSQADQSATTLGVTPRRKSSRSPCRLEMLSASRPSFRKSPCRAAELFI